MTKVGCKMFICSCYFFASGFWRTWNVSEWLLEFLVKSLVEKQEIILSGISIETE